MSVLEKEKILLTFIFLKKSVEFVKSILDNAYLVQISDLPTFDGIQALVLEPEIDILLIERYFTDSTFQKLKTLLMNKKSALNKYFCCLCNQRLAQPSIRCDHCLRWFDFKCSGLNKLKKDKENYFCHQCKIWDV